MVLVLQEQSTLLEWRGSGGADSQWLAGGRGRWVQILEQDILEEGWRKIDSVAAVIY